MPERNRGTIEIIGLVPYDEILAIDEHGDEHFSYPHVYVPFRQEYGPFSGGAYALVVTYAPMRQEYAAEDDDQIKHFPPVYPEVEP